jgi:DNA repair protein RadC
MGAQSPSARDSAAAGSAAQDFFRRLAELPLAAPAAAAFDRLFRSAAARPPAPDELYRALVGEMLDALDLPRSAGGLLWEWRPLLTLHAETDPFYFTESQIARRLAECPPLGAEARAALTHAIQGFLKLRRGTALERLGPLVPAALQRQWVGAFPAGMAWRALDALRSAGLCPAGSAGGYRAFRRFTAGEFEPPLTADALVAWEQTCQSAAAPESEDSASAQRAGFSASAFAGELSALGIEGPCGAAPRCDACPLREACAWAQSDAAAGAEGESAALARARLGRLESLSLERLLDGLFALEPAARERLRGKLKGQSLRSLAAKSAAELEEWMRGEGRHLPLDPARLLVLFELCRRFGEERLQPGAAFTGARDVYQHFRLRFRDLKQERFLVVLLDVKKRYLSDVLVTQGGLDTSPVHPREVFAPAVQERAAFVLLVHNHPSGDPAPSPADLATTRELVKLGQLLGIAVLDHVILGDGRFASLRESGLVEM